MKIIQQTIKSINGNLHGVDDGGIGGFVDCDYANLQCDQQFMREKYIAFIRQPANLHVVRVESTGAFLSGNPMPTVEEALQSLEEQLVKIHQQLTLRIA